MHRKAVQNRGTGKVFSGLDRSVLPGESACRAGFRGVVSRAEQPQGLRTATLTRH